MICAAMAPPLMTRVQLETIKATSYGRSWIPGTSNERTGATMGVIMDVSSGARILAGGKSGPIHPREYTV